jgi:hypothetical protein
MAASRSSTTDGRTKIVSEREELLNFADLVERMRAAQKRYFETRKGTDLGTSKQLERTVDVTIEIIKERTLL